MGVGHMKFGATNDAGADGTELRSSASRETFAVTAAGQAVRR